MSKTILFRTICIILLISVSYFRIHKNEAKKNYYFLNNDSVEEIFEKDILYYDNLKYNTTDIFWGQKFGFFYKIKNSKAKKKKDIPHSFNALYLFNKDDKLVFKIKDSSDKIFISIGKLDLSPNTEYNITQNIRKGYPTSYFLQIMDKTNELVFWGVSLPSLSYVKSSNNTKLNIELNKILEDHFIESKEACWDKITNLELKFTYKNESITLVQGQTKNLDNYLINLGIAKKTIYSNRCCDGADNEISFVIVRKEKILKRLFWSIQTSLGAFFSRE